MDSAVLFGLIMTVSTLATIVLGLWQFSRKIPTRDRVGPLALQIPIFGMSLMPISHGFPREMIVPMILAWLLAPFAVSSSYRAFRIHSKVSRCLAVSLFVQAVTFWLGATGSYIEARYFYD